MNVIGASVRVMRTLSAGSVLAVALAQTRFVCGVCDRRLCVQGIVCAGDSVCVEIVCAV